METQIASTLDNVATTTVQFITGFTSEFWPWLLGLFVLMGVIGVVLKVPGKMVGK